MGFLPLHRDAQQFSNRANRPEHAHAGLWYDRFFNGFLKGAKKPDENKKEEKDAWAKGKSEWIKNNSRAVGDPGLLEASMHRRQALVDACGGTSIVMATDWHFVTGLGNNHPVENGFAWHPTLGVPYLTGAAVKGMLRAWCEVWEEDFDDKKISLWFGDTDQSGQLIFFDAVPTGKVQLKADIMTPHYGKWYAEGATRTNQPDTIPADWHDPNPVPFLVVDAGQSFQFAIAKRPNAQIDLGEVMDKLKNALQWIGAGAKTAAGYGRMHRDESEEMKMRMAADVARKAKEKALAQAKQAREKKARQAAMSPLQIELDEWLSQLDNLAEAQVGEWLDRMEKADSEDALEIANALDVFFKRAGKYIRPSKKQKVKNARLRRILDRGK